MRVSVADSAGFCSGVKRALKIARATIDDGGPVHMLGEIVHNESVLSDIAHAGARSIKRLDDGRGKTLLICAHGVPARKIRDARRRGYRVIDATCPMVKRIHRLALELEREGRRVIVIGDSRHDEVKGIVGQLKKRAVVVSSLRDARGKALRRLGKAGVVVQSTQNQDHVMRIVEELKTRVPDLTFHNTICSPTRSKQREMASLPLCNDVMIIIGSSTSANTRRLYQISKSLNSRTYRVKSKAEIDPRWFRRARTAGVGAGASTPDHIIREVVDYLAEVGVPDAIGDGCK